MDGLNFNAQNGQAGSSQEQKEKLAEKRIVITDFPDIGKGFNLTWLNHNLAEGFEPEKEMAKIGVVGYGQKHMGDKAKFYVFRAENITNGAANILKQEFLAKGAEAAVHPMVVVGKVPYSSVLMYATAQQYKRICQNLSKQQFGLPALGEEITQAIANISRKTWVLAWQNQRLTLGAKPKIMGILNLTPDSFSDGGSYKTVAEAVAKAVAMVKAGAEIIDVGGESTRPGYLPVTAEEEIARIVPVIKAIKAETNAYVSVDTYKSRVAAAGVFAGADLINDIWGLQSPYEPMGAMAKVAAGMGVPVVAMHNQLHTGYGSWNPNYAARPDLGICGDILGDMGRFFRNTLKVAADADLNPDLVILDIGFGFGKNQQENLLALGQMAGLKILGRPILVGTSRKSTLGAITGKGVEERVFATGATVAMAIDRGAAILRVHDVEAMRDVALVAGAVSRANSLA